jgi:hypothetical protein
MRRASLGAAVLLCMLPLSHAALADRDSGGMVIAGRADDAARSAELQVPRFSSAAWIDVGMDPFRMVAADLNGDGKADLAVVEWIGARVSVMFGDGTGQFGSRATYRTGRRPVALVASDLDGDGRLDLATASASVDKSITVFINRGAGRFRRAGAYAAGRGAYGVAAGDVNGDGIVDLLSAHASRKHFTVLLGQRAGGFRVAHRYRGGGAFDVAAADLNSDGELDVVFADSDHNAVTVRLGRGDGTFGRATAYNSGSAPFGVAMADLNHDGKLDITAANFGGAGVSVLLGAGDGSFGTKTRYPMGDPFEDHVDTVLVADYDRDGHLDIATPGPYLRRGRGDGTLEDRQPSFSGFAFTEAGAVADFDGDGWPDLAFSEACEDFEGGCEYFPPRSIVVMLNWTGQPTPPCVVPPVIGATERQATRQLASAGCRVGQVRHRYSREGRRGTAIRQRPKTASVRPNNTPVDLVVSRGRRQ